MPEIIKHDFYLLWNMFVIVLLCLFIFMCTIISLNLLKTYCMYCYFHFQGKKIEEQEMPNADLRLHI